MTSTRELTGLRLSETARCPRMAAYRGLGTPEDELPFDVSLFYRRGHFFERLRAEEYKAEYGAENIETQRKILWPGGVGHCDIYVIPTHTIVEIVSAVNPSSLMLGFKIEQVRRYLHFDTEAEHAIVEHIDPSRLAPIDSFPVKLTDEDRERIDAEVEELAFAAMGGGPLPDRVCTRPTEARQHLCPFGSTCFHDWQEPAFELDTPEARALAAEGDILNTFRKQTQAEAKAADEKWRDWQGRCVEAGVPEGTTRVGPITIKRTPVRGRETFRLSVARKAGVFPDHMLGDFVHLSEPHERWSIERDGDGEVLSGDDFGDAPF